MEHRECPSLAILLISLLLLGILLAPANDSALTQISIAAPAAPAVTHIQVFQYGLAGYTGVADTWVSTAGWDTPAQYTVNYGQNSGLELTRNAGDNPLLRFDVSSIPPNSAVLTATLALYNTTRSSYSGTKDFARRIELFRVLREWDEGNQVASPINATGKHGATGDYAFAYYPGEGANDPWNARGMAAGSDYAATRESYADVVNEGWYEWDVTALVRAWVREEQPNAGLVLRDATGYAADHTDWRTFVSSQGADPTLRPKLTVVYNPDVPYADAGPDQVNLSWDGGPVTLDASASHDRPGGDDGSLTYAWRIVEAAYGSGLAGPLQTANGKQQMANSEWRMAGGQSAIRNLQSAIVPFAPDTPGEWELELTVTNNIGESATDRVHLRLLKIPAGHPRIYLTPEKLATLRARAIPSNPRWSQLRGEADSDSSYDKLANAQAKALVGLITGQESYCDRAITAAAALLPHLDDDSTRTGDIAAVYDWCHDRLTVEQIASFVDYFNTWGDATPKGNDSPGWGNYWPRWGYSYALAGLATYGDNPRAQEWLDEFRYRRYRDSDLPLIERIAAGGAWPEGPVYDWIANWPRVKTLDAWLTATGEDLFASTSWYRERLGYLLLQHYPGSAEQWSVPYHPYPSIGDAERNRGSMTDYGRIMGLILIGRYPADPLARQLQAYLATPPVDNSMSFLYHEEFLWFDPSTSATNVVASAQDGPAQTVLAETPTLLTRYAAGTGTIFMRSAWPTGAADVAPEFNSGAAPATYLTFQAGDHFTYHQHYDQNSFTLFKRGDLAVDSGVYSGDGRSDHDINYYVRTIAHNTLIVYNPTEDFTSARPDAYSVDGGQRTMYRASRSPDSIEYFDLHRTQYDTADMLRFEDSSAYTYALGDATKAYNNPTYNQAMDGVLTGNVAKVSRFQREFVYLRPMADGSTQYATRTTQNGPQRDYVILFDRVGVTQPAFSGQNTKLLFHVLNEPAVNGAATVVTPGETLYSGADLATAVSGDGKLFIKTLLPAARNLRVVGGRGVKSFWVFDRNYDWHWDPAEPQPRPTNDFEEAPYGEWRLELEPADTALEHNFLTVLYPAISTTLTMPATSLMTATGLSGAHIADPDLNRVTLFSAAVDGAPVVGVLAYSFAPTTDTLHVLFDLPPGSRYTLAVAQNGAVQTITLSPDAAGPYAASDQGVLSFVTSAQGAPGPTPTPTATATATRTPTATPSPTVTPTPTMPVCVRDVNADGVIDVVDIQTALVQPGCDAYLPLIIAQWRKPAPTATPTRTPTPTPTHTPTRTQTPTRTPTRTPTGTPTPLAAIPCAIFPADSVWNVRIEALPTDISSSTYINTIGPSSGLHADFGSGLWDGGPIGIPYAVVPTAQPLVAMTFAYADESDPGPYPIPADAPVEGGRQSSGDRHVLIVRSGDCALYETWDSWPTPDGSWYAGSGARFSLTSHALRPETWTSADAAGLPILPGLVRYDEVASGEIRHALRFTVPQTRRAYLWPARHYASSSTDPTRPPMGQRFRLKASFDISGFSATNQVILTALKRYGMFLADNGSAWFLSGAPDARWDNDDLHLLQTYVHGSDFEAVDESALMIDPDSGQARP